MNLPPCVNVTSVVLTEKSPFRALIETWSEGNFGKQSRKKEEEEPTKDSERERNPIQWSEQRKGCGISRNQKKGTSKMK